MFAGNNAEKGENVGCYFYGTEGTAVIEGDRLKVFHLKDGTNISAEQANAHALSVARGGTASVKDEIRAAESAAKDPGAVWGDAHREQLRDFIHAIETGGQPMIHGAEGRKPLEIILAVYESAKSGREITLG